MCICPKDEALSARHNNSYAGQSENVKPEQERMSQSKIMVSRGQIAKPTNQALADIADGLHSGK